MSDYYEDYLLGRAVRAFPGGLTVWKDTSDGVWTAEGDAEYDVKYGQAPTLAAALTALLRDLGEEVPERPRADYVAAMERTILWDLSQGGRAALRSLYAREPLTVLALLEDS